MTTSKQHRKRHLRFRIDRPENREIVRFFAARITEEGKITAPVKNVAIGRWGLYDSCAGMARAFRQFKRTHHFGVVRVERIYPYGNDVTAEVYGYIPD